jgi:chromosome partitioning protein
VVSLVYLPGLTSACGSEMIVFMNNLLTAEQFAERMGFTARHIRQLANLERIEGAQKRGRDWLFEPTSRILEPRTLEDVQHLFKLSPVSQTVVAGVYNQAGGVGKTTLTRDLGFLAALWGLRVLVVDMDGQANLTSWLGVSDDSDLKDTVYPFVAQGQPLAQPKSVFGVALIPASLALDFESRNLQIDDLKHADLRQRLPLENYDLVLLDTPPSVTNLLLVMLRIADKLVVPVETASKGLEGMRNVNRLLEMHRDLNPQIRVSCYVPTRYDPRASEPRIYLEALKSSAVFPVSPPVNLRVSPYTQATSDRAPIPYLYPASAATTDLLDVGKFVFKQLGFGVSHA